MGFNDHIDYWAEAEVECISHLLKTDEISHEKARGVARQIIGKGLETLSERQMWWYNKAIKPLIPTTCPMCEGHLQDHDLVNVVVNEMNCTDCEASIASWPE